MIGEPIGVEQQQPEVLAPRERLLDPAGDERNVELIARAVAANHERIKRNAEFGAQVSPRRRRIDDMRHGGVAAAGHRVGEPRRNIGVGVAARLKKSRTPRGRRCGRSPRRAYPCAASRGNRRRRSAPARGFAASPPRSGRHGSETRSRIALCARAGAQYSRREGSAVRRRGVHASGAHSRIAPPRRRAH